MPIDRYENETGAPRWWVVPRILMRDVGQNEIGGLGSQFNRKYIYIAMIAMTSMTARGVGPRPVLATRYEDSNGIGDRAIPPLTHVFAPSGRHIRTLRAKMVAPVRAVSESKVSQEALVTSLPLSMATMLLSCAPSYAEEAVAEATKEAADIMSENSGVLGYTNGGLVVAFSPLVIYGGEYQRVSKNKSRPDSTLTRSLARPLVRQCSICTARPSIPRQKFRIYCSWRRSAWWRPTSCRSPCSIVESIDVN